MLIPEVICSGIVLLAIGFGWEGLFYGIALLLLRRLILLLRGFLDEESSEVVDDELDMLDGNAGLCEVLGNLNVAEAGDKVIAIGDGRIDMLS
jgi:hypothetical protein